MMDSYSNKSTVLASFVLKREYAGCNRGIYQLLCSFCHAIENACNAVPLPKHHSQPLSYPLGQLPLSKVPQVGQALLRKLNVLHRGHVLRGRLADARGNDDGIGFEDDAVVDELIDGERLWLSVGKIPACSVSR